IELTDMEKAEFDRADVIDLSGGGAEMVEDEGVKAMDVDDPIPPVFEDTTPPVPPQDVSTGWLTPLEARGRLLLCSQPFRTKIREYVKIKLIDGTAEVEMVKDLDDWLAAFNEPLEDKRVVQTWRTAEAEFDIRLG